MKVKLFVEERESLKHIIIVDVENDCDLDFLLEDLNEKVQYLDKNEDFLEIYNKYKQYCNVIGYSEDEKYVEEIDSNKIEILGYEELEDEFSEDDELEKEESQNYKEDLDSFKEFYVKDII